MPKYDNIIENATYDSTLRLTGGDWNNTLVRNVVIENVDGNGVFLRNVKNITLENVTIRNVSGDGIKLSTEGSTSNVVISNSNISRIGEDGINAGQRYQKGVDHPGLEIIGNTIDQTGLNGGADGLRHGIYVQSTNALIEGNHVTNSVDGNGISVRSSGIVRDNLVESSSKSGIAYYADHMGRNGNLVIENNTVVDSGYSNGRSDINLLSVPNQSYLVDSVSVHSNNLEKGATGVQVGNGYREANVSVKENGEAPGGNNGGQPDTDTVPEPDTGSDLSMIVGDNSSNILRGTAADEHMFGLGGADVFILEKNGGTDTVADFEPGVDRIAFYGFDSFNSINDLIPSVSERGGNTVVRLGGSDNLIIADTDVSHLSTSDFFIF